MHGRSHIPSGYASIVTPASPSALLPQGGSDQIPSVVGTTGTIPWVRLGQFSRTVTDSTWTTIPWRFALYDPAVTTLGGVDFTLSEQAVGLGHNIWQVTSEVSGLYLYDLITSCTFSDPTLDAGVFSLRLTDGINELDEIYDASDVFKSTTFASGSQGEYLQIGRIRLSGLVYVSNQAQVWKPQVQQSTGGSLAVGGEYFYLARVTSTNDAGLTTLTTA
jgi:hypothetical protein